MYGSPVQTFSYTFIYCNCFPSESYLISFLISRWSLLKNFFNLISLSYGSVVGCYLFCHSEQTFWIPQNQSFNLKIMIKIHLISLCQINLMWVKQLSKQTELNVCQFGLLYTACASFFLKIFFYFADWIISFVLKWQRKVETVFLIMVHVCNKFSDLICAFFYREVMLKVSIFYQMWKWDNLHTHTYRHFAL